MHLRAGNGPHDMRFQFRPFPGLTVFTLISVIILIGLGNWQYDRLQWKTSLLEDVEQAVTSPPLESLKALTAAIENKEPVDFRRIEFAADILPGQLPYLVYTRQKNALMWRRYFAVEGRDQGQRAYAAGNLVPDSQRGKVKVMPGLAGEFAGYVRIWRAPERGTAKSTAELNRWFGFDPFQQSSGDNQGAPVWAQGQNGIFESRPIDTRYYIDLVPGETSAQGLPIKRPDIRNNHFDYMLTWYSFAVILLLIYVILHVQRGRLGFKPHG
jgi:surfeit locus 1 family protein